MHASTGTALVRCAPFPRQARSRSSRYRRCTHTAYGTSIDSVFCFGSGFCVADLCRTLGSECPVAVTSRSPDSLPSSCQQVVQFDGLDHPVRTLIRSSSHVLVSVPPEIEGLCDQVLPIHEEDVTQGNCTWLGYLSSTAVYGDWQGQEVDEETPLLATSPKLRARMAAEQQWLQLYRDHGIPVHIFRLGGIYGPGRSLLDAVRKGVQALLLSMARPTPGEVFNLVDDDCTGRATAMAHATHLLGLTNSSAARSAPPAPPSRTAAAAGPPATQTSGPPVDTAGEAQPRAGAGGGGASGSGRGEKRVSNAKAKRVLGWELAYPSYREGLAAIAAQEE